jgi:UDP-glucose 4-epimerase
MVEQVLADCDKAYGLRSVCLRYFNAAGADPEGELGERHQPETHLIALVLQAASGRRSHITVHGQDYDTPDGTCIRDYVHVLDLADAHLRAMDRLLAGAPGAAYNLGTGRGHSVREVLASVERVVGQPVPCIEGPRRAGDPPALYAVAAKANRELGWVPRYLQLDEIIRTTAGWARAPRYGRG